MKFTVIWQHRVVDELTRIYLQTRTKGHSPETVTRVSSEIDALLENRPE